MKELKAGLVALEDSTRRVAEAEKLIKLALESLESAVANLLQDAYWVFGLVRAYLDLFKPLAVEGTYDEREALGWKNLWRIDFPPEIAYSQSRLSMVFCYNGSGRVDTLGYLESLTVNTFRGSFDFRRDEKTETKLYLYRIADIDNLYKRLRDMRDGPSTYDQVSCVVEEYLKYKREFGRCFELLAKYVKKLTDDKNLQYDHLLGMTKGAFEKPEKRAEAEASDVDDSSCDEEDD